MACNQHSPTTSVNFFKIICKWDLRDEKIQLPMKFSRKYGRVLPNPIVLKVEDGSEWRVNWNKNGDGKVWLEKNGWKEFVQHYFLAHGHLVLFKYDVVSSEFAVQIFDTTTLEIDYPLNRSTNSQRVENSNNRQNQHMNVDVVKIEENDTNDDDDDDDDDDEEDDDDDDDGEDDPSQQGLQEDIIVQRGRIPKPPKNPSFKVKLGQSYVKGRCIAIPKKFARKYMNEGAGRLRVLGKARSWNVEFKFWKGANSNLKKYKLQKGWYKFRRDNNLQVGDVCVFELVDSTNQFTFNVLISRS